MNEHEDDLTPEAIDALIEHPSSELSRAEQRLIRDMHSHSAAYARENERSLEQIWGRLVQSQEQSNSFQGRQQQEPGSKQLFMEGKAMQHDDIYQDLLRERQQQQDSFQEKEFATLNSQPTARRRRSLWRTVSISVAAAVVLLAVLGWALLSAGLRQGTHNTTVGNNKTTQTGLSAEKLLCSFSDNNSANKSIPLQPSLDWSANGQIATTYNNLKTFSARGCAQGSSIPGQFSSALWSPDGKRLLVFDQQTFAQVLDASTGQVVASFPPAYPNPNTGTGSAQGQIAGVSLMSSFSGGPNGVSPTEIVAQSVWSADGTQVISVTTKYVSQTTSTTRVVVWNASTGAVVRVALTLPSDVRTLGDPQQNGGISPDGKYIAVQNANNSIGIWSIDSGKLVSTIPFSKPGASSDQNFPSAVAWSPDDASLALGLTTASEVQVWSIANGQLIASFTDHDTAAHTFIGALAWSPNGKYLAESGSDIHIWDVATQKTVITFGKVEKGNWIATLAWSPDSSMLASSSNEAGSQSSDHTLNSISVWQLS